MVPGWSVPLAEHSGRLHLLSLMSGIVSTSTARVANGARVAPSTPCRVDMCALMSGRCVWGRGTLEPWRLAGTEPGTDWSPRELIPQFRWPLSLPVRLILTHIDSQRLKHRLTGSSRSRRRGDIESNERILHCLHFFPKHERKYYFMIC